MADSINGSDHVILNWDTPTRVPPNAEPHVPGRHCQRLAQTIYQSSLDYRWRRPPNEFYVRPMLT